MANTVTANGCSVEELLNPLIDDEDAVERVSHRKIKPSLDIVEPDPAWATAYAEFESRIISALGAPSSLNSSTSKNPLVSVSHVGSTSVPGLPAKAIIDIDIIVSNIADESFYVPALEAQGFQFLFREPKWYEHRFFIATEPMHANVHVWPTKCAAVERHNVFREWLIGHREDRELYAKAKREASEASTKAGENMRKYTDRKDGVIQEIMSRAYRSLGYAELGEQ